MKIGLDTNVLIRAHLPGVARHEEARDYLLEQLALPDVILAVTPLVLHEFVHVVTDERRFAPPVSMSEAVAVARGYLGRANVECLPVDEDAVVLALDLLVRHRLGRKRIADALLAATLLSHDVQRLATFDAGDFALFEPLRAFAPPAPGCGGEPGS